MKGKGRERVGKEREGERKREGGEGKREGRGGERPPTAFWTNRTLDTVHYKSDKR